MLLMELRHLDALLAIERYGSFTAAADELHTVQSNVSDMVRQIETELGVPLLVRGRRGAEPTEFGKVVLERARRIRGELDALQQDISMIRGLETGRASLGVVGTVSRRVVPGVVADLRDRATGVHLRVTEGASERLVAEVAERELAQALVTEPVTDSRVVVEHVLEEDMVAVVPAEHPMPRGAEIALADLPALPMILPPLGNPLRAEIDLALHAIGSPHAVLVEVEGVRLIADLVAEGQGMTIMPSMAAPDRDPRVRAWPISDMPRRRLALVSARGNQLSLADQAVRDAVIRLLQGQSHHSPRRPEQDAAAPDGPAAQATGVNRTPSSS
jgi:DNA-binding transcriptional LysR family regulator